MVFIRAVLVLAAIASIACAPATSTGGLRNANLLTRAEIVDSQAANAYEVINRLRGTWLKSRGRTSILAEESYYPLVYLDGQRYGEIEILRTVPAEHIKEIRFIGVADATTRFGTGHTAGVIEVITR